MLYNFIMAIHIIVSMVLILVILMQAGRGSGMSEMFGGSSTRTIFGASASNFLVKATAASAVIFIITCLTLAIMSSNRSRSLMESPKAISQGTIKTMSASKDSDTPAANEKEPISSQP